ncbi:hypothetical protein [Paraliobacillus sediminis]|nr:hypothetical protein [Paraliobacillus sediminis]
MNNVHVSNNIDIKSNRKSIVSLVLGIIEIVYGFLGLKEVNRLKQNGKRL